MLAAQVVEFHEAPLGERGLRVVIRGDAQIPVDEPLFKRAVSNLLGNAVRYADEGSRHRDPFSTRMAPSRCASSYRTAASPCSRQHLPRLFDRFFRSDSARSDSQSHHGLGLSIVAAIARMHAGRTFASCDQGTTRLGFTMSPQ